MAQRHVFGKSINFSFLPQAYDEDLTPSSLVSARLYSQTPTDGQKGNDGDLTNQVGSEVTSWTSISATEKTIVFPALTDPDPYGSKFDYTRYYVVVNFKLEASAPTISNTELIHVYKVDSLSSAIRVTYSELVTVENKLDDYLTSNQLTDKINVAIDLINKKLLARGIKKRETYSREDLNLSSKLLAVSLACRDIASNGDQIWLQKADYWEEASNLILDSVPIDTDNNNDDESVLGETKDNSSILMLR